MKLKILILAVLLLPGIGWANHWYQLRDQDAIAKSLHHLEDRVFALESDREDTLKKIRGLQDMMDKVRGHLSQPRAGQR